MTMRLPFHRREGGRQRLLRKCSLAGVAAGALMLVSASASAATCTLNVVSVNFGSYDPFASSDLDSTGSVTVSCDSSVAYSIAFSAGQGSYANREMLSGSNVLEYNLFTDPIHSAVWGDGTAGTMVVTGNDAGAGYDVYGRIPAQQNPIVGSYSDTVVVTLTF